MVDIKRYGAVVGILGLAALAGCSSGESFVKPGYDFNKLGKIAVVDVTGSNLAPDSKNLLADNFGMEFLKKGFDLIERNQIQKALTESKFQASGLTNDGERSQLGKVLNVQAIVVVNVPELGNNISMTAKLMEVETGSLLWVGSGTGSLKPGAGILGGALGGSLAGGGAGHAVGGKTGTVVGAVAGGVGGGTAGYVLEPGEAEMAIKVIRKIGQGIPNRAGSK